MGHKLSISIHLIPPFHIHSANVAMLFKSYIYSPFVRWPQKCVPFCEQNMKENIIYQCIISPIFKCNGFSDSPKNLFIFHFICIMNWPNLQQI